MPESSVYYNWILQEIYGIKNTGLIVPADRRPVQKQGMKGTKELAEFMEEERQLILSGCRKEVPAESVGSVGGEFKSKELPVNYGGVPRNLRVLLN